MNITTILKISRPRFWLYIAGTYLVGYSFGISDIYGLNSFYFFLHFLFFLIPANIFLYGVNDICDEDTDQYNDKKGQYEHLLLSQEKRVLLGILVGCVALSFFILAIQPYIEAQLIFSLFLFLSYFYSAPPLRFKAKPFVDFASNILYVLPALFAYFQTTNSFPPLAILVALFCWTSAMHIFSSIPDISADKKAKLKTTAVLIGTKYSLVTCAVFWTITACVSIFTIDSYLSLFALMYPAIPLILLANKNIQIKKAYKLFPYINTITGFALFLYAIL